MSNESREAFEAFYMTLDDSEKLHLYRTTKPFRGVPIGDYKWVVTRSMYVGWQAAEQSRQAEVDKAKELLEIATCPDCGFKECTWCNEVAQLIGETV
jgi:hypothetical protein